MACLQAQVVAFVFKHRANVRAFKLGVLIVSAAGLAFDGLHKPSQLDFAFHSKPVGLHINRHFVLGHGAVFGFKV